MAAKDLLNVGLLAVVWTAMIVFFGFVARAAVWLFCLGYGC